MENEQVLQAGWNVYPMDEKLINGKQGSSPEVAVRRTPLQLFMSA